MKKYKVLLILLLAVFLNISQINAQIYTDYEAKSFLKKLGFTRFFENAGMISFDSGVLEANGGIYVGIPVYLYHIAGIENVFVVDRSISFYGNSSSFVLKANILHLSAAYGEINGEPMLIAGKSLKDIANELLKNL
ncbi:MAG: hypothetical protein ACLFQV_01240 [Vulcanimicrobiota bacterium]